MRILLISCLILLLTSCNSTDKIVYLQNAELNTPEKILPEQSITIQPKDMMSIIVSSKDPKLATLFNLPISSVQAGTDLILSSGAQRLGGYIVDLDGNIDFPILGKLHVAGLNRWQLQELIKTEIRERDLIKDLIVTVEFMNFKVSILGEVKSPGSYSIDGDKVNLLEALSMAGDLTIHGLRDEVYVIRENNNKRQSFKIDLRSKDLFSSPAYYLKQNDIIYVKPDKVKAGQSTINQNSMKSVTLWISIASLLTSVGILVANILDN